MLAVALAGTVPAQCGEGDLTLTTSHPLTVAASQDGLFLVVVENQYTRLNLWRGNIVLAGWLPDVALESSTSSPSASSDHLAIARSAGC